MSYSFWSEHVAFIYVHRSLLYGVVRMCYNTVLPASDSSVKKKTTVAYYGRRYQETHCQGSVKRLMIPSMYATII